MWFRRRWGLAICLLFLNTSCSKTTVSQEAKDILTNYISKTFSIQNAKDRSALLGFLTGEAHQRLKNWSEEEFIKLFVNSKREFIRLSFREIQKISDQEIHVTYELIYFDRTKGRDVRVAVRRLAELIWTEGAWKISEVRNLTELIDYRGELAVL